MDEKPESKAKVIAFPPLIVTTRMIKDVAGISKGTALKLEKQGKFPKRRKIQGADRVGWALSDIRRWAECLPFVEED